MKPAPFSEQQLGFAPATGKDAVSQCIIFKGYARAKFGSVDGAWLETVVNEAEQKRGLVVRYDKDIAGAEAWAQKVHAARTELWRDVVETKEIARAR